MSLNTGDLFEQMCDERGMGRGNTRTSRDFITAVNNSIYALNLMVNSSTEVEAITSTDADIDDLDANHRSILERGVRFFLTRMGHTAERDKGQDYAGEWEDAKGDYWAMRLFTRMATSSNDVVGLGYRT